MATDRRQDLQPAKPVINLTDIFLRAGAAVCGTAALTAFIMVANAWKDISLLQADNRTQAAEIVALKDLYRLHAEADARRDEELRAEAQSAAVAGAKFDSTLTSLKEVLNELLRSLRRRG